MDANEVNAVINKIAGQVGALTAQLALTQVQLEAALVRVSELETAAVDAQTAAAAPVGG